MTQICAACNATNRDRAKYCRGCAGKLTDLRGASAASAESLAEGTAPFSSMRIAPNTRRPAFPGGLDRQVLVLMMTVVLAFAAFLLWYWDRTARRSAVPTQASATVHRQQASTPSTLPISTANAAAVATPAQVEPPLAPLAPLATSREVQPATPPVEVVQVGPASSGADDTIITEYRDADVEPVAKDNRRSARATAPRTDRATTRRSDGPGRSGASRAPGGTRHCDRYNPFGEAIC